MRALLVLILTSCGSVSPTHSSPELSPMVRRIESEAQKQGIHDFSVNYPVVFEHLPENVLARAYVLPRYIAVSPAFWYSASDYRRFKVLTHEIGHASFRLPHDRAYCQEIMSPYESPICPLAKGAWDRFWASARRASVIVFNF